MHFENKHIMQKYMLNSFFFLFLHVVIASQKCTSPCEHYDWYRFILNIVRFMCFFIKFFDINLFFMRNFIRTLPIKCLRVTMFTKFT